LFNFLGFFILQIIPPKWIARLSKID